MQQEYPAREDRAVSPALDDTDGSESRDAPLRRQMRLLSGEDEAKLKTLPPRADAWLERRLRVFEKSIEIIETQQKEMRAEHRSALVRMDETVIQLHENLAALQAESRSVLPELQSSVKNMRFRLDVVEAIASAALEGTNAAAQDQESQSEILPEKSEAAAVFVPSGTEVEPDVSNQDATSETETRAPDYLECARQHANAAAAEVQASALASRLERARNRARYKRQLLTGIAIGAAILVVSASISFHRGYLDGRAHAAGNHSIKHKTNNKAAAFAPSRKLLQLAQAGNRDAQLLLALKYYPPKGEPHDATAARYWMARAAQAGQPMAQYLFAKFEERGIAAPVSMTGAIKWYEAAAWAGNRKAMNDLAVIFAQGAALRFGVAANPEEAALWFYRAADTGSTDAQFNLAILYERGLGVPQSPIHAYKWYALAAAHGDLVSRQRLSVLDGQMNAEDLQVAHRLAARFTAKVPEAYANILPDETKLGAQQMAAR